ncbi:MAG: cytochrome c3 family protein [Polaribacter sp.]|jgi:mono/diheme cytochrome c family protein|uniref:cytochrome c3 family protein n=1 Tax=Polaribacter sp. TaxID=1920175 RepID=UPI00262FF2BD|nr:cytochrome c3 family protein [Polaribacter sp.]MBT3740603.1 c-type cytochrome [Polaribacter sp.]MBT7816367.1 c-type cytochrome [Polaribacter sp.]MDG1195379.1 cytochrome c3 family protein [Polaribacter sp.]MDG1403886.1 cytochrome c3 family protein [Polaribacter sp.]MDG2435582.1 cytochrome c3 family protein [Polaribacter sp.]
MKSVAFQSRLISVFLKSLTLLLIFGFSISSYSQEMDEARQKEGRKLFRSLCVSCHKLDKKLVGPALGAVEERRENDWLKAWIKNNAEFQKVNAEAYEAAQYSATAMNAFPQLTDKNIDDILYYTTVGEIKKAPAAGEVLVGGQVLEKSGAPDWLIYILAAAIVVAFLMIASLLKQVSELKGNKKPAIQSNLRRDLQELWVGVKNNTFLKVLSTIFLLLIGAYIVFGMLFSVGVDQGYQPIQPIAFSHKIHAGDNKIDCQYCHSSAKHSKHSGIPSVNVCMNCHKAIAEVAEGTEIQWNGQTYGKTQLDQEIAKVYKAAGWDPEELEYTGKERPIKWIRLHNLPDFVYYNHAQHVTVAGLKCQKCHGPVEEMDEMYQYSSLTMGWCINCHRETNVDLKGNEYYAKIHDELAKKYGVEKVTISQLGGLECGKCHY